MPVHRGAEQVAQVEQPRDLGTHGPRQQLGGRRRLQAAPAMHQHHPVGEHLRLVQIVRDQQDGDGEVTPQRGEFRLEAAPSRAVHRREGLVQQQHGRVARERARHRHPLLLPARQFGRSAAFETREMHARQ